MKSSGLTSTFDIQCSLFDIQITRPLGHSLGLQSQPAPRDILL